LAVGIGSGEISGFCWWDDDRVVRTVQ
jgi:hypothetical protein